jgi:D-arabinose 1-dehydrogenase-like Zn-dependent alcohol dehydrogenase
MEYAKQCMNMCVVNTRYSATSASWEVATATQITRSGATTTGTLAIQLADHIGGSACVLRERPDHSV